jgi:hypothetical protein
MNKISLVANAPMTTTRMAAALVMGRPVRARPRATL